MSGAKLVPELLVSDHAASRDFYVAHSRIRGAL